MEDCLGFDASLYNCERSRKDKVSSCVPENTGMAIQMNAQRRRELDRIDERASILRAIVRMSIHVEDALLAIKYLVRFAKAGRKHR